MGSYINALLKTEVTGIPGFLNKYFGKYYNNALCNGTTWMVAVWTVLHLVFDDFLNGLLKKMKYKEYKRMRLKQSLWYLGFYTTACIYCTATLYRNDLKLIDLRQPFDSMKSPSGHLILGFIVMLAFYLHSAFWEWFKFCSVAQASSYLCLFLLLCFSYFLRFVEGTFRLTVFICLTQISLELARCAVLTGQGITVTVAFFTSISAFILNYLILIPIVFGYPLYKGFSPSIIIMVCLLTWLIIEINASILLKALYHFINHNGDINESCEDVFECSLFPPRCDATYNFQIMRKEMMEREEKSIASRRPKKGNAIFQTFKTLKCMVAIKRKLKERRRGTSDTVEGESVDLDHETNSREEIEEINPQPSSSEVVNGKLEFNISNDENCKCKQE